MKSKSSSKNKKITNKMNNQKVTDDRFAHVHHDPRFKTLNKKSAKLKVDDRFKSMFTEEKFQTTPSVDKYGKNQSNNKGSGGLEQFYELEQSESENDKVDLYKDSESEHESMDFDPARGIGLVDSSDEEDETEQQQYAENEDEDEDVDYGEETNIFAVCGLDWDKVKASHLFVLFNSFKPSSGAITNVNIYPSEFGKNQLAKESKYGPQLFEDKKNDETFNIEEVESEEMDERIRLYQLQRRKYYYAVVECDCVNTASVIYKECDNQEFETSGDVMDLRFIPEDMDFDDEPTSTCTSIPADFKPVIYKNALQDTGNKLDWDEEDEERSQVLKKTLTKEDIESMDFANYLASGSDESDNGEDSDDDVSRNKYASLLEGLGNEENDSFDKSKKRDKSFEGNVDIVFRPGLASKAKELVDAKKKETEDKDKSVWQKYLDRKKETKKNRRKEARKLRSGVEKEQLEENQLFSDDDVTMDPNDSFFGSVYNKPQTKLATKSKKEKLTAEEQEELDRNKAELEMVMMDDQADEHAGKHFNMKTIEKNQSKKKKRKPKKGEEEFKDDFVVDSKDDRFKAMFENHEYSIDKTHGSFKNTDAMKEMMKEGTKQRRKRRKNMENQNKTPTEENTEKAASSLSVLVNSVKRKSNSRVNAQQPAFGKRIKRDD